MPGETVVSYFVKMTGQVLTAVGNSSLQSWYIFMNIIQRKLVPLYENFAALTSFNFQVLFFGGYFQLIMARAKEKEPA